MKPMPPEAHRAILEYAKSAAKTLTWTASAGCLGVVTAAAITFSIDSSHWQILALGLILPLVSFFALAVAYSWLVVLRESRRPTQ